ncbi:MAG: DUF839 domain-containing protein, partial [Geminicoccaceae bacterium]|nr:DUF839 domain-containing protein [Geminicoccaceae bacterium]
MRRLDEAYRPLTIDDEDDLGRNRSSNRPLLEIAASRISRRTALKGFASAAAYGAIGGTLTSRIAHAATNGDASTLGFESMQQTITDDHRVAPGYTAKVLIRWGDPVLSGAPEFDPMNQTADAQAKQFGYNNDFLGYFPLPKGSGSSEHGLLHVNHEYTSPELMFPGWVKSEAGEAARQAAAEEARQAALAAGKDEATADQEAQAAADEVDTGDATEAASIEGQTAEQSAIEMVAHAGSVIEVRKENGSWSVVPDSRYARRITLETPMRISGPAAGDDAMKTSADPTGTRVVGMLNNCAGGRTPWGTILTGEENIRGYFWTDGDRKQVADHFKRYGIPGHWYAWGRFHDRFNIDKESNESNRFGYIVEIDPYDPRSTPVKRTALGRMKHEGA